MARRRRTWVASLVSAIAFGSAVSDSVDAQSRQHKVLVLYGTPAGVPVQRSASALIRERLAGPAGRGLSIYEEFFDDDWTFAPPGVPNSTRTERAEAFRRYLASRYAATKFDLILAVAYPALQFYQTYGRGLFPGTPVIACLVPSDVADSMPRESLVSIVTDSVDLEGTLDLALTLQPATKHVVVIGGASPFDTSFLRRAQALRHLFESRVDFTMIVGRTFGELERRVATLPPNSVILFLSTFADSSGNQYAMADIAEALTSVANAPVYAWNNGTFGRGAVGGHLVITDSSVALAVGLANRLIAGAPPESLPRRVRDPSVVAVDWRQLRRWGIDEQRVPPGTVVEHPSVSVWRQYRVAIALTIAVLLAQTAIIAALVMQRMRRRRAESARDAAMEDLRASRQQIQQLVARLITAQEAERIRIGRELHDDVNQRIAALAIALSRFRQQLPGDPPGLGQEAERLQERTAALSDDVRRLSHQLHSSVLQHAGLEPALRGLASEFSQRYGVSADLVVDARVDDVSPDVALCLYRVMQEALRNTATHARAKHVRAALTREGDTIDLSIIDDGRGFDMTAPRPHAGLGLVSIAERVSMLGGVSRVIAHPGDGTQINIRLPAHAVTQIPSSAA